MSDLCPADCRVQSFRCFLPVLFLCVSRDRRGGSYRPGLISSEPISCCSALYQPMSGRRARSAHSSGCFRRYYGKWECGGELQGDVRIPRPVHDWRESWPIRGPERGGGVAELFGSWGKVFKLLSISSAPDDVTATLTHKTQNKIYF